LEDINSNESLFTDYALEMVSAFLDPDKSTISALITSYSSQEENSPAFLPGLLFGCLHHISILLSHISEITDTPFDDCFKMYAINYHSEIRETLTDIKGLSPSYAASYLEKMSKIIENAERTLKRLNEEEESLDLEY